MDFYNKQDKKIGANRVDKKIVETIALQHEFMQTQQEYKEMADRTKDNAILKYGVKDYIG